MEVLRPDRAGVRRLEQRDRYGLLLVMILASLVGVAFSDEGPVGRLVAFSLIGATLVFALHTSEPPRRLKHLAWGALAACALVAAALTAVGEDQTATVAISGMCAFLVAVTLVAILRRVAAHPRVDLATVGGALCVYLLVGLFYAFTYIVLSASTSTPGFFVQTSDPSGVDFIYFSFITISTTGYGDLTPATDLGRMLAVTEAVAGQLYLVSAVALVIGNLGRERPMRRAEAGPSPALDPPEPPSG
jgi:hypothetical protein